MLLLRRVLLLLAWHGSHCGSELLLHIRNTSLIGASWSSFQSRIKEIYLMIWEISLGILYWFIWNLHFLSPKLTLTMITFLAELLNSSADLISESYYPSWHNAPSHTLWTVATGRDCYKYLGLPFQPHSPSNLQTRLNIHCSVLYVLFIWVSSVFMVSGEAKSGCCHVETKTKGSTWPLFTVQQLSAAYGETYE